MLEPAMVDEIEQHDDGPGNDVLTTAKKLAEAMVVQLTKEHMEKAKHCLTDTDHKTTMTTAAKDNDVAMDERVLLHRLRSGRMSGSTDNNDSFQSANGILPTDVIQQTMMRKSIDRHQDETRQDSHRPNNVTPMSVLLDAVSSANSASPRLYPSKKIKGTFVTMPQETYRQEIIDAVAKRDLVAMQRLHDAGTANAPTRSSSSSSSSATISSTTGGSPLHTSNASGETLLHTACRKGHTDVAMFLMEHTRHSLWVHDEQGKTPLHLACWSNSWDLFLSMAEIDPDLLYCTDARGHAALDYVPKVHHVEWIEKLRAVLEYQHDNNSNKNDGNGDNDDDDNNNNKKDTTTTSTKTSSSLEAYKNASFFMPRRLVFFSRKTKRTTSKKSSLKKKTSMPKSTDETTDTSSTTTTTTTLKGTNKSVKDDVKKSGSLPPRLPKSPSRSRSNGDENGTRSSRKSKSRSGKSKIKKLKRYCSTDTTASDEDNPNDETVDGGSVHSHRTSRSLERPPLLRSPTSKYVSLTVCVCVVVVAVGETDCQEFDNNKAKHIQSPSHGVCSLFFPWSSPPFTVFFFCLSFSY